MEEGRVKQKQVWEQLAPGPFIVKENFLELGKNVLKP